MMYETGIVYSLKEVGEKFIEFAQQSNSNTQSWELLDDRLSSFYGATLKIPMKDWEESGDTPYFYVSLEHMDIVGEQGDPNSTYASWIRTGIRLKEYVAKTHEDEYKDAYTDIYYQSEKYNHSINIEGGSRSYTTKYGARNRENIFKNTGELIAVGLHTLYDNNLWMCEQGQVTCKKESTEQINDLSLLPVLVTESIEGQSRPSQLMEDLPVFPGTGCPWFTISDDNKEEFEVESNGIKYWFTKNDYDATITIMLQNHGAAQDSYQSMSFGRLEVLNKSNHMFPLYVAGGTEGLSQDTMVYTPPGSSKPTNMGAKNVYDLNIRNICLSNSNLLSPTKFNGANMSNFRVLSPDGTWKDIYGYEQDSEAKPIWDCGMCNGKGPGDFTVLLNAPKDIAGEHHAAYHCMAETWHRMDIYTINREFNGYEHSSTLERVLVFLNSLCDFYKEEKDTLERDKYYGEGSIVIYNTFIVLKCIKGGRTSADNVNIPNIVGARIEDGSAIWEVISVSGDEDGIMRNANGYQGLIPNVYANWFRELPTGEITLNNKKYLSVPNGWETRLWNYESDVEPPSKNDLDNDSLAKKMDDILKKGNNNIMSHRLLIPLEDGA